MAKKTKTKISNREKNLSLEKDVKDVKVTVSKFAQDISKQVKLGESYISLVLGAVVVLGVSAVLFVFIRGNGINETSPVINDTNLQVETPIAQSYTLQEGESLWDVAVKFYGDGYRYIEILEANKNIIDNPDFVPPGTKLIIPNLK